MKMRNICATLNNYTEDDKKLLFDWANTNTKYFVYGEEVGTSGTPHLQMYLEPIKQTTAVGLNKVIGGKKGQKWIHCESRKGTAKQAAGYCKKGQVAECPEWDYFYDHPHETWLGQELGELSNQGARTDLLAVRDRILDGSTTVDDLCVESPALVHQYGRTLDRLETIRLRRQNRSWMTKGTWLYGPTGVGKSHAAFDGYTNETHYLWNTQTKWQDGYKGQPIVVINDYRGEIPYNLLLQMVDKWPFNIERRGREVVPFLAREIIITSSLTPQQIYCNREREDSLEQMLRRFTITHLTPESAHKCSEGNNNL